MKTLLVVMLGVTLSGCVSLDAKACFGVPQAIRNVVGDKVPKDGCPVDFHYSNMEDPEKK